jgi:hypothetical protein
VAKLRGTRAGLLALIVALLWPALLEGKTHHKGARKSAPAPGKSLVKRKAPAHPTIHRQGRKPSGPAVAAAHSRRRRATRIIRQDADNQVVLEWIRVAHPGQVYGPFLPSREAQVYGPFLPALEAFDFPPAPCQPSDVVLEAHVHDESSENPENQVSEEGPVDEAVERQSRVESLVAVAKRISSLLRPKSASARVSADDVELGDLLSANLRIPVEGVDAQKLRDSFLDGRGRYRQHLAIDIGAPRGTPVVATTDGEITRLRREKRGGITIYQKDATGKYLFFYCHLSRYAMGLAVGQKVGAGEVIGYVGSTGHVIGGPHLHFSITRVPEDDDFREGLAINPYLLFLAGVP